MPGGIVEQGGPRRCSTIPAHPYTLGLLRSTPRLDELRDRLIAIDGAPPNMIGPPQGCAFAPRCPSVDPACDSDPELIEVAAGRRAACVRPFTNNWSVGDPSVDPHTHGNADAA